MANTKFLPQSSKTRSIKGFGENVSQLPLCINVFCHYVSLQNVVSQEVLSHFDVFRSPMENWVLGYAYATGVITHEGYTLVGHSIISHSMHYLKNLGARGSNSYILCSVVDCVIEDYLKADQQTRKDLRK
jgi:hypothetical protein